jgi:hypothetical protein
MKFERIGNTASGKFRRQPQPKLGQVGVHSRRIAKRHLFFGVERYFFAELNILLGGEHVPARL